MLCHGHELHHLNGLNHFNGKETVKVPFSLITFNEFILKNTTIVLLPVFCFFFLCHSHVPSRFLSLPHSHIPLSLHQMPGLSPLPNCSHQNLQSRHPWTLTEHRSAGPDCIFPALPHTSSYQTQKQTHLITYLKH